MCFRNTWLLFFLLIALSNETVPGYVFFVLNVWTNYLMNEWNRWMDILMVGWVGGNQVSMANGAGCLGQRHDKSGVSTMDSTWWAVTKDIVTKACLPLLNRDISS